MHHHVSLQKRARSTKLRLCYASVELNKHTKTIDYPLPIMEDIIESMKGKKYFTLLDLKSGYWQIPLEKESRRYFGMKHPGGIFQWNVLPFGPKNGPAHFQRVMNDTLRRVIGKCALVYIDDIIIFSDTFEDHIKHINEVLECLNWLFSETEQRYSTTERELYGLILAARKWQSFFLGKSFLAKTDHKALTGVMKLKDPYNRISRWMAELNQYNYSIEYIPGVENTIADPLS